MILSQKKIEEIAAAVTKDFKQSESAKKPLNTVFQDICKHEVLGGFFTDKSFNLENPQKVS